jgi:hypothetical protein
VWLWGVGKAQGRSPRVKGEDPRSIFGTLGVVRSWGECNHVEGRTKRGREGQRG